MNTKSPRTRRRPRRRAAALLLASIPPLSASAELRTWDPNTPGGTWSDPANWIGGAAPANYDAALLNAAGAADVTATYDLTGNPIFGAITLQSGTPAGAGLFTLRFDAPAAMMNSASQTVGADGAARIVHAAGMNAVIDDIVLSAGPNGSGAYELSGGEVGTGRDLVVGAANAATFTQTGGINRVGGNLLLRAPRGAASTYTLAPGALLEVYGSERIGPTGAAAFTQTGGTHTVALDLIVDGDGTGAGLAGPALFDLRGGRLTVGGAVTVGFAGDGEMRLAGAAAATVNGPASLTIGAGANRAARLTVSNAASLTAQTLRLGSGAGATGLLDLAGGSVTLNPPASSSPALALGATTPGAPAAGTGTVNIRPGATLTSNGDVRVGDYGDGVVNQTGGTHTVPTNRTLVLNLHQGLGVYNLSGGTLRANVSVGNTRDNQFHLSGAANLVATTIGVARGTLSIANAANLQTTNLTLGHVPQFGGGTAVFNINGGSARVTANLFLENYGTTRVNHTAGDLTVGQFLQIGNNTGDVTRPAEYAISGGRLLVTGNAFVGTRARGLMTQTNGTVTANNVVVGGFPITPGYENLYTMSGGALNANVILGNSAGAVGTLTHTGGVVTANEFHVGLVGKGTYNLDGGQATAKLFTLGNNANTQGTVNHTAGTLAVNTTGFVVGFGTNSTAVYNLSGSAVLNAATDINVGYYGRGTFNQTGGTVNLTSSSEAVMIGNLRGSSGTYNLSAGLLNLNWGMYVGFDGDGTFNQSGGTVRAGFKIGLTSNGTSISRYTMTGGTLTSQYLESQSSGPSTFSQTNGAVTLSQALLLGSNRAPHVGAYRLAGGTLDAAEVRVGFTGLGTLDQSGGDLVVRGMERVGSLGVGTVNQTGGTHSVAGTLRVGFSGTIAGTVNLAGGTLTAPAIDVLVGSINQTGGTLVARSLALAAGGTVTLGGAQSWQDGAAITATGGTLRFDTDPGSAAAANLALDLADATATFAAATQHLRALRMTSGVATLTPGNLLVTRALALEGPARLDLTRGAAIVDYAPTDASPLPAVRAALRSAHAGGAWTGPGLTSSDAAADARYALGFAEAADLPPGSPFAGHAVDDTAVLVRFTLAGDANLDGAVDFNDLVALAQNYSLADGTGLWSTGDFTYDGAVDFNDLVKLAQNYNAALPADVPFAPAAFESDLARAFAAVPEPAALPVAALIACGLAGRRRRRG